MSKAIVFNKVIFKKKILNSRKCKKIDLKSPICRKIFVMPLSNWNFTISACGVKQVWPIVIYCLSYANDTFFALAVVRVMPSIWPWAVSVFFAAAK